MKAITGVKKIYFGTANKTGEKIYISIPSWDCEWYWSFGYLGNKDCHYHLSKYANGRNINMYDALKADYILNPKIDKSLWEFCELSQTIYTIKEYAEVLHRGGAHYTTNSCKSIIKNAPELYRLNNIVLSHVMQNLWNLIS